MAFEKELEVALDAVVRASRLCQQVRTEIAEPGTLKKDDRSPVTVADYGAQAVVLQELRIAFPDIPAVAEESSAALKEAANQGLFERVQSYVHMVSNRDFDICEAIDYGAHPGGASGRFWALDPIDGTKGFLRNDQYAVALGLIEDGEVVLGVLGCPALAPDGAIFTAVRGQGAQQRDMAGGNARTIRVREPESLAAARFVESVESGHTKHGWSAQIAERLGITNEPVRMDSQAKYAALAQGAAQIYLRLPSRPGYRERIWDHAAAKLVAEEAGARISDVTGAPLDFSRGRKLEHNRGVVAATPGTFDAVIEAVKAIVPQTEEA
ncbi:MAG: 3'(2'),5'-bisphosphate nucleotidase [Verrucomicrobiota bacterium]